MARSQCRTPRVGEVPARFSLHHREYSLWSAVTVWTACAPPDRVGRRLAQAEVLDLAILDQVFDRTRNVLDRHIGVHATLIVQVDPVGAEPRFRRLCRPLGYARAPPLLSTDGGCAPAGEATASEPRLVVCAGPWSRKAQHPTFAVASSAAKAAVRRRYRP